MAYKLARMYFKVRSIRWQLGLGVSIADDQTLIGTQADFTKTATRYIDGDAIERFNAYFGYLFLCLGVDVHLQGGQIQSLCLGSKDRTCPNFNGYHWNIRGKSGEIC